MSSLDVQADNAELAGVRFGRNRLLVFLGSGFIAGATKLALVTPAFAHTTPTYCHDAAGCHCCSGGSCCEGGCTNVSGSCESGTQCWVVSVPDCCGCYDMFSCCDFNGPWHGLCICRSYLGKVC